MPENVIEYAKRFGGATRRDAKTVLADALEMIWPTLEVSPENELYLSVSSLCDAEVLEFADAKMHPIQKQRLGALQEKGKATGLTIDERYELMALMQIYPIGQLCKSEARAETVRRGLRTPLP